MVNSSAAAPRLSAALEELSRVVLAETSMDELLGRVVELAIAGLPGVDDASITVVSSSGATSLTWSGRRALALDERQYADGGPCVDAAESGEVAHVRDTEDEARWPDYVRAARAQGVRSSLSVPVPLLRFGSAGLNLYADRPDAFDEHALEAVVSLAGYAGVALANMQTYDSSRHLAEQLKAAMGSRAVIEQAKGIVMARHGCTADTAFGILVGLSQATNRKLRDVAGELVAGTPS